MSATTGYRVPVRSDGHPALSRLLSVSVDKFAAAFWGRAPLLSTADQRGGDVSDLFSPAAVDELVSQRGLRTPFLRVARGGTTYADRQFTDGGGIGAAVGDQVSDDKLLRLFAEGATLVLQGLHRTWPAVATFTQQLAADLGHPVQANAYVTPAQSTGFSDHYDVHDVFVLQVSGEKQWRIHAPVHPLPLRDEPWTDHRDAVEAAAGTPPLLEVTMRPGDCLYLPRGYLHAATALGGVSTHLTLGIHAWTGRHVADALVADAVRRVSTRADIRSSLPLAVDLADVDDLAPHVEIVRAALLEALRDVDVATLADVLGERSRRTQRAAPVGPVAQTEAATTVDGLAHVRLRAHLAARLVPQGDGSHRLVSRAASLPLTDDDGQAVRRLLADGACAVAELGTGLTRRLLLAGVVVPMSEGEPEAQGEG